ncbi:N-formylglutamate amidohydrolase [Gluconobacter sphaericus]|uniref:N-formylglutamate amidohydrolase n=1 Tax=Gluconobacter sphaericus NBRC 12467 TaxID=1307951 RepID=A0AA37WB44_9PROT|nr:N-formylglutamate amidohydrolase [Gluconobacter sphaericus]MBF0886687.1 N-formylglutamate amidohydrolase [Gluconobacter sphaericus]MBS1086936.1 N-formylglutamate amidohydrolase [Gluconobacter sphaericus]MBS1100876.1 N-formylglutamate amidohydrolase [Gluconobacter sphaericus]GBR55448.1 N-formylglutamate amidohydrolase [Gluconobacter sphaericus NBRC 12467]GEB44047.1 N-formylglutamate amidohydrolase [Gluconobacter sphaericus NBRC 12467]
MKIPVPLTSFTVNKPRNTAIPLLVSSPHSGRNYPSDFLDSASLSFHELQQSEDRFVDRLFEKAPDFGATLICAELPRVWCDVNRDWREVDAEMFDPRPPDDEVLLTEKVKAGFGVIPRYVSQGRQVYGQRLHLSEIKDRIAAAWLPYHEALTALLSDMKARFGYAILLEAHSMPKLPYARSCDVVLGDVHGRSCVPALPDIIENILGSLGYSVRRNIPYAGGYITQYYGRPEQNIHAVQLEICRSLYLNAATLKPGGGFEQTQQNIQSLLAALAAWVGSEVPSQSSKQEAALTVEVWPF